MAELREQCWSAFYDGRKEDVLRLLPEVEQPHPDVVHYAATYGWQDVCQQLVENYNLNPSHERYIDGYGHRRPLHRACKLGRVEVVKYLLTLPSVILTVNERDEGGYGFSALRWACMGEHLSVIQVLISEPSVRMPNYLPSDKFPILSLLSRRISGSTEFPITPYFPVFMAGNTAAGKTTLTKAMIELTHPHFSHGGEMVTGVKTLTAGICPLQCSG